jgi:hypothetical protein
MAHRSDEVKAARDWIVHARSRHLVEVALGTRTPAWKRESIDGEGPILDRGDDQYLDLLANVEAALGALQIGVAT